MIEIDSSKGEGGGQILRTACGLSALTGKPFRIFKIRAKRSKPGLRPQHLHAVRAVKQACEAEVTGAELNSQELTFTPNKLKPQKIRVNIGTAGSTTLILQALMIPATKVQLEAEITGGTDNPFAPPIDYLINVNLPMLAKLGYQAEAKLIRRGHYPAGLGRIYFKSHSFNPSPVNLHSRGELKMVRGLVHATRLSQNICYRELQAAKVILLNNNILNLKIEEEVGDIGSPGTGIVLWAECEHSVLGASSLGKLGKRAELVGKEAAEELLQELESGMALDFRMADQIIPYLALTGGSVTCTKITQHVVTCADICNLFLERKVEIEGVVGKPGRISVK
jgi:RNA 3'-terminal phosphate cyclase (GTP)